LGASTNTTTILGGAISISTDANLGAAPVAAVAGKLILDGGTLMTTANMTLAANRGIALGPINGSGTGTLDVASTTNLIYNGIIANRGGGVSTGGNLVKTGGGTLTLGAASTYTGTTTIKGGSITLGTAGSFNNSSSIIVGDLAAASGANLTVTSVSGGFKIGAGKVLAGHGNITGGVTILANGITAPGNSIGTTTYNTSLTYDSGAVMNYEFGTPLVDHTFVAGSSDLIAENGGANSLVFNGTVTLNAVSGAPVSGSGSYQLFSYTDANAVSGFVDGDGTTGTIVLGSGWDNSLPYTIENDTTANGIFLNFGTPTGVPEPMSLGILGLGAAAMLMRRRK
jgi:autotransporter-associated beta strand protein